MSTLLFETATPFVDFDFHSRYNCVNEYKNKLLTLSRTTELSYHLDVVYESNQTLRSTLLYTREYLDIQVLVIYTKIDIFISIIGYWLTIVQHRTRV